MANQKSSLDEIGLKFGTDKSSLYHDYLSFYETFFEPLRTLPLRILEIGILGGASLRTWREYFPNAEIVGVDISPTAIQYGGDRISVELADQSNIEEMTALSLKHGPFDLIIEDGSHLWEHQITSLRILFPFLRNGGIYIIEDLQTNYGALAQGYKGNASLTCVDFLKSMLDLRVGDDQVPIENMEDPFLRTYGRAFKFMTFYRRACLIKKDVQIVPRGIQPGPSIKAVNTDSSRVRVVLNAHVGSIGDVVGLAGCVNRSRDGFNIQGFSITISDEAQDVMEYRARSLDGVWSDWARQGDFVGTRGQSRGLSGVTVRLTDAVKSRFSLECAGLFLGDTSSVHALSGQDCLPERPDSELCGLQVDLRRM